LETDAISMKGLTKRLDRKAPLVVDSVSQRIVAQRLLVKNITRADLVPIGLEEAEFGAPSAASMPFMGYVVLIRDIIIGRRPRPRPCRR
jgi:hypothetical protein